MTEAAILADLLRQTAIGVTGSGLLAATVAVLVAGGYRWATTRTAPAGVAILVGLASVAGYLTVTVFESGTFFEDVALDHQASAGYLLATFAVAGTAAMVGGRLGDRIACQVLGIERLEERGEAVSTVRSARLGVELVLPETIEDAEGYRPIEPAVRRSLSGTVVRLPHGLTVAQRRDRLERHLERDYDVGHATVTMAADGSVDRVLVGRRTAGLGSLVPPKTVAVAIRTDPLPDAGLGDPIEIWSTGTDDSDPDRNLDHDHDHDHDSDQHRHHRHGQLIATGTLRTTNGSVATVLVDAERAAELSPNEQYRLVTRPDESTDSYEFASTIRTVDETVTTLSVDPDGPLAGEFVGWLPGRVLVIDRDDDLVALPEDNRTLRAGDTLWLLASPAELTAFEPTTTGTDSSATEVT